MIPVFKPSYDEREFKALKETLQSGWIGLGPKTKEFEERFAEYMGTRFAVGTNSATAGLHLAMKVMEVAGGEVITTPMTFISTNHAILYNNATPVFCDIEEDTLNIDPLKIEPLITSRTKMIVAVHYGGYACDMDKILAIAERHNLKVLEDAAHGCGGEHLGKKLGTIGDIGVFSFHAVKNLSTGEGGMIVTNDEEIYKRLLRLRWMGVTRDTWQRAGGNAYSWYYDVEELGYKYHMSDIAATLGIVQLSKLDDMNKRRAYLTMQYNDQLQNFRWIKRPVQKDYQTKPAYHNYVIKTPFRDILNEFLKNRNISTGVHYIPNNSYKMYKLYPGETPIAASIWKNLLTLPLYPDLKDDQLEYIVSSLREFEKEHGPEIERVAFSA